MFHMYLLGFILLPCVPTTYVAIIETFVTKCNYSCNVCLFVLCCALQIWVFPFAVVSINLSQNKVVLTTGFSSGYHSKSFTRLLCVAGGSYSDGFIPIGGWLYVWQVAVCVAGGCVCCRWLWGRWQSLSQTWLLHRNLVSTVRPLHSSVLIFVSSFD